MKRLLKLFLVAVLSISAALMGSAYAAEVTQEENNPTCQGKFFNPFTDVCWSCVFPLSIGGKSIFKNGQEDTDTSSGNPFCMCQNPPKVGVNFGFWEPIRIVEAVRTPYCFTSLGGIKIDPGIDAPAHTQTAKTEGKSKHSFYQVHWYTSPLLFWLQVLSDDSCLERGKFDLAYFTELDPLWADSEATFLINPEVALFSNPVTQAVCALDCATATAGFPLTELFWCAGCQGSMYPLNGYVQSHIGGVQASALLVQRMTNKLHREMLIWGASGTEGQCSYYPEVLMNKRNYKMQMIYPKPWTDKIAGKCCSPFGRSTTVWGSGREFPYKGEDFAYQLFRKRDCCSGSALGSFGGGF